MHANLELCLPELSAAQRRVLERRAHRAWGRSVIDLGVAWWGRAEHVRAFVRVRGLEHARDTQGRGILLVGLHTVGLEIGGLALSLERPFAYAAHAGTSSALDRAIRARRERWGTLERLCGRGMARDALALLARGGCVHVSPDLFFDGQRTRSIELFGRSVETLDLVPRLARASGALVVPCVTRQLAPEEGYEVELLAPWEHFPSDDLDVDLRRMNAHIEASVRAAPEQYRWSHDRFGLARAQRDAFRAARAPAGSQELRA